jgi:hypothetical protein
MAGRQRVGYRLSESPSWRPVGNWLACAGCNRSVRVSGMVLLTEGGRRVPLCFDCYQGRTGGVWRDRDEYWDGSEWVPMRVGR